MLGTVWQRYRRPMIIGETSGIGHGRASWLRDVAELRRWQTELNRVTRLDEDPFSDPVELQDVIDAERAAGQGLVLTKVRTG